MSDQDTIVRNSLSLMNALAALKIKRARFVSTGDGVEIHQPGKPRLLLTLGAVRDFAAETADD